MHKNMLRRNKVASKIENKWQKLLRVSKTKYHSESAHFKLSFAPCCIAAATASYFQFVALLW